MLQCHLAPNIAWNWSRGDGSSRPSHSIDTARQALVGHPECFGPEEIGNKTAVTFGFISGGVPACVRVGLEIAALCRQKWNASVDVEDLQTFVEVADAGGVSSAARRLGVSKSIISRRLFRLEAELGVQLLARTTRGAALTEAGVTFREHAARVCAEIDIALETIMPAGELRGRLRIAAPLSLGPTHLAPVFAEMARRHPMLHLHASYSDHFVDIVGDGFDCAIRVGYLTDSNLIA